MATGVSKLWFGSIPKRSFQKLISQRTSLSWFSEPNPSKIPTVEQLEGWKRNLLSLHDRQNRAGVWALIRSTHSLELMEDSLLPLADGELFSHRLLAEWYYHVTGGTSGPKHYWGPCGLQPFHHSSFQSLRSFKWWLPDPRRRCSRVKRRAALIIFKDQCQGFSLIYWVMAEDQSPRHYQNRCWLQHGEICHFCSTVLDLDRRFSKSPSRAGPRPLGI